MSTFAQRPCTVVRSQEQTSYEGKQGMTYFAGISAETAGAQQLSMILHTFQPGQKARVHLHENHESAIYILRGMTELWYGDRLQNHVILKAGDFVHIPANVPHVPWNTSQTEVCTTLIARGDPNEQESVVLLPELENVPLQRESI
jgi:uncharacterized RmlC-like cupin family protein